MLFVLFNSNTTGFTEAVNHSVIPAVFSQARVGQSLIFKWFFRISLFVIIFLTPISQILFSIYLVTVLLQSPLLVIINYVQRFTFFATFDNL